MLTDLIADPDSEAAATGLTDHLFLTFKADPGMASAAVAMIARFYRRQADGGDVQALVDLGDFLYGDEPEAAQAVVCTEQPGSFEVAGIDQNGTVLARLRYPFRPPTGREAEAPSGMSASPGQHEDGGGA